MDILSQLKPQAGMVVTTPTISAPTDAAAIGTAPDYARGDHVHGREGWVIGPPCVVVATSNVTVLAGQGQTIDGYTVQAGDRVLITAQGGTATSALNGPWIAGANPWVRPDDYSTGGFVQPNRLYMVSQGTAYHDTGWTLNNNSAITVDTTATGWSQVAGPFATPAIVLGSSAVAGSAGTPIRSDATIAAFDTTVPVVQAFGDVAAVGSAAFATRRDHRHGVPVAAAYNAITNPACNIFQVGNSGGAAPDNTTWADSWTWQQSGGGAVQNASFVLNTAGSAGNPNYSGDILQMLVTTADTSIGAAEYYILRQLIEGYNVQPLGNSMSLSFYFYAVKAGIYSVSLRTRSSGYIYVMEANIASNVWTYFAYQNIPAPPAWEGDMRKQSGLILHLVLAAGSNYQTSSINAWNTAAKWASTNQVNGVDAINNSAYLYGVNLVPGPYAIPYRPHDYQSELERVRRYRQRYAPGGSGTYGPAFSDGTTTGMGIIALSTPMISTPAAVFSAASTFWHYQLGGVFTPTGVSLALATPVLVRVSMTGLTGLTNGASGLFMDSGAGTSNITLEAYPT